METYSWGLISGTPFYRYIRGPLRSPNKVQSSEVYKKIKRKQKPKNNNKNERTGHWIIRIRTPRHTINFVTWDDVPH